MSRYNSGYKAGIRDDMDPEVRARLEDYNMMLASGASPEDAWAAIEGMGYDG